MHDRDPNCGGRRQAQATKARRAGGAFVLRACRRSACAFRRLARIRPTGAPCSTQVRLYDLRRRGASPLKRESPQFAKVPVFHISTASRRYGDKLWDRVRARETGGSQRWRVWRNRREAAPFAFHLRDDFEATLTSGGTAEGPGGANTEGRWCPGGRVFIGQLDITRVIVHTLFKLGPFALLRARAMLSRAVGGSASTARPVCGGGSQFRGRHG